MKKPRYLWLLIGGIAAILVSGIAIAALAMSDRHLTGATSAADPTEQAETPASPALGARASKCAECGVIESTREIEISDERAGVSTAGRSVAGNSGNLKGKPLRSHEITIRMQDGSMLVITDPNPAKWKQGERVKILAGVY